MTNEEMNVPELRFPEFNEDWNERTISDSIKILKSGLSRELSTTDIGLPVIRANNLQNYNLVLDDIKYWFKEDPKGAKTENYYLEKNDILVNFINSESKMGTSCIIKSDFKRDTIYTTNILRYVTKEAYDSYFHYIYTQTYNYKKWIKIITKPAVNQASFTTVDFKKIPYYIPGFKEQQKIGNFFSKLDQQIELEEQKLSLLKEQKKGYMQKIFSQELRFKDENENGYPEWDERCFFDNIQKTLDCRGKTPKKLGMEWSGSGYLALSALNVKNGYIDYSVEANYGDENLYHKWMQDKELKQDQVLFTTEAPMGNVAQVPDNRGYILSQRTIAFEVDYNKITDNFLAVLLNSSQVHNKLISLSSGATAKGVSQKSLKKLHVNLPESLMEQEQISDFFNKIDEIIEKQSKKVDLLKERKKGFLQKMFV